MLNGKNVLQELSIAYDIIDCVLAGDIPDITAPVQYALDLQQEKNKNSLQKITDAAVRVARISAKVKDPKIKEGVFKNQEEKKFYKVYTNIKKDVEKLEKARAYEKIVSELICRHYLDVELGDSLLDIPEEPQDECSCMDLIAENRLLKKELANANGIIEEIHKLTVE